LAPGGWATPSIQSREKLLSVQTSFRRLVERTQGRSATQRGSHGLQHPQQEDTARDACLEGGSWVRGFNPPACGLKMIHAPTPRRTQACKGTVHACTESGRVGRFPQRPRDAGRPYQPKGSQSNPPSSSCTRVVSSGSMTLSPLKSTPRARLRTLAIGILEGGGASANSVFSCNPR